ncbi:MAG TPA: agmatine deiminase family protein [Terriglobia bacterium]|nr:agmatine deiminase family protein [Terriglobia bacterium]
MQSSDGAKGSISPAALGYRLPAEWEPHEATWIGWPHNRSDWPGKFTTIPWVYAEIVRKIAPGEIVRILVNSKAHEEQAKRILRRVGVDLSRLEFFRFPTNRGWTRDFGPIFVKRDGNHSQPGSADPRFWGPRLVHGPKKKARERGEQADVAIVDSGFNGWAKYPDWEKDNRVASLAARALGCRRFVARALLPVRAGTAHEPQAQARVPVLLVLEGGSIDGNGRGTLLTTEECLLDPEVQVRNPGFTRQETEEALREYLGVKNVLWLGKGIAGDDTHGHVDDFCRFVGPRTVVLCRESNRSDANYRPLEENRERLQGMRLEDGSRIEVVALPMPAALFLNGQRLPASYANFYISNSAVLVPTFNDSNDRIALGTLGELFQDRAVIGIHAVDLVWGLGTLHCLTHEQPAA